MNKKVDTNDGLKIYSHVPICGYTNLTKDIQALAGTVSLTTNRLVECCQRTEPNENTVLVQSIPSQPPRVPPFSMRTRRAMAIARRSPSWIGKSESNRDMISGQVQSLVDAVEVATTITPLR
jgi:hypothetical protein